MRFLADENVPVEIVDELRRLGHEVSCAHIDMQGAHDESILERSQLDARIPITIDKDFGELAFRRHLPATMGVILIRVRPVSPEFFRDFVVEVLQSRSDWAGHFSVIEPGRIRMVPIDWPG